MARALFAFLGALALFACAEPSGDKPAGSEPKPAAGESKPAAPADGPVSMPAPAPEPMPAPEPPPVNGGGPPDAAGGVAPAKDDPVFNAINDAGRPEEHVARDGLRKPGAMLVFAEVKPGMTVAEILPGEGYYTRLLSKTVGAEGKVFAIAPAAVEKSNPEEVAPMRTIAENPAYANVRVALTGADMAAPELVDLVFTSQNYHDLHIYFGETGPSDFNKAAFASLKPGGAYVIIDHSAVAGSGTADTKEKHRIDIETVKAEVVAAGFTLEATSDALANADDARTASVFDDSIRGRTDQFALRFRKPK